MKKLLVLLCMSVSVMGFSQEWGGVDKNTVTMKGVAPTWPGCESKSGAGTDACGDQGEGVEEVRGPTARRRLSPINKRGDNSPTSRRAADVDLILPLAGWRLNGIGFQ